MQATIRRPRAPRLALVLRALTASALVMSALTVSARSVGAQAVREIGTTSVGTPVLLEPASVSRRGDTVTAAIRTTLKPPIKNGATELRTSRTIAMFDCARKFVATKESWYYTDDRYKTVGMHRVVKLPGFGPAFDGSLPAVALTYLCAKKP